MWSSIVGLLNIFMCSLGIRGLPYVAIKNKPLFRSRFFLVERRERQVDAFAIQKRENRSKIARLIKGKQE
jgi:hypothetical protein